MQLTVYTSRAKQTFTSSDFAELGTVAASVNYCTGITGLLVFDGDRFIQALEGDAARVQAIMNRITKDPRHDNIAYVENTKIGQRQFDQWSTEYRDVGDLSDGSKFLDRVMDHVADVENDLTKAAFIGFAALSLRRRLRH